MKFTWGLQNVWSTKCCIDLLKVKYSNIFSTLRKRRSVGDKMVLTIHLPKMDPSQWGKKKKEPRNNCCWCWVDVVIPAGWPMKSDPSGGCGPDGPPTTCFPNFSLQNIREHQRNVLVSIHNHFTILADLIVAPVQIWRWEIYFCCKNDCRIFFFEHFLSRNL